MKIKVNKHKLNIHYRGSRWGSRTQQHAYCLRYAHCHHIEAYFGKKQLQAKIAIAFLFGQLHFNNVTSHALFYGGHLVMRSKRCAVQNQGITLKRYSVLSVLTPFLSSVVMVIAARSPTAVKLLPLYGLFPVLYFCHCWWVKYPQLWLLWWCREAVGPMGGWNKVTSRINDNLNVIKITHHNTIQIEFGSVTPKRTK